MPPVSERLKWAIERVHKDLVDFIQKHNLLVAEHNLLVKTVNTNTRILEQRIEFITIYLQKPWYKRIFSRMPEFVRMRPEVQEEAEVINEPTQKREKPKDHQQEYQDGDGPRQTAETGRGDSFGYRPEIGGSHPEEA